MFKAKTPSYLYFEKHILLGFKMSASHYFIFNYADDDHFPYLKEEIHYDDLDKSLLIKIADYYSEELESKIILHFKNNPVVSLEDYKFQIPRFQELIHFL